MSVLSTLLNLYILLVKVLCFTTALLLLSSITYQSLYLLTRPRIVFSSPMNFIPLRLGSSSWSFGPSTRPSYASRLLLPSPPAHNVTLSLTLTLPPTPANLESNPFLVSVNGEEYGAMYPYSHPMVSGFRRLCLLPFLAYGSVEESVEKPVRCEGAGVLEGWGRKPEGRYDVVVEGEVQLEGGTLTATTVEKTWQRVTRVYYWRCFGVGVGFFAFWYGVVGGVGYWWVVKKMEEAEEEARVRREEMEREMEEELKRRKVRGVDG